MWLLGGSHGLGSFPNRAGAGLRVPGHLLLLSVDLGDLPHRAPLQYSGAAFVQGALRLGSVATQRAPAPECPRQWLRGAGQRPRRPCGPCTRHRPQAQVFLGPGGGQLSHIQRQAAKQRGMHSANQEEKNAHRVQINKTLPNRAVSSPLFCLFYTQMNAGAAADHDLAFSMLMIQLG